LALGPEWPSVKLSEKLKAEGKLQQYIARRLLLMIPTLIGITVIVFMITRLTPQDTVDLLVGEIGYQDEALKDKLREEFGLTDSIPQQYLTWMGAILRGDLGSSLYTGNPVTEELRSRVPVSVQLGVMAMLISVSFGVPIGIISAVYQDKMLDYATRGFAILILAIPNFWLALLVIVIGSRQFGWAPPARYTEPWTDLGNNIYIMITPALILGLSLAGTNIRLMRTQMLEVLRQDYIRTARAKGLAEVSVLIRHAAKNALIPVVTVVGLQITVVIAGSVILENIFMIPGVGRYVVESAQRRDLPILQGLTLIIAAVIVVSNLIVDVSYAYLDPRVKYR
jgi:peptide/nickel transport system permease protein